MGEERDMMLFITLFYEYFKIGLFALGGGLATIPFLYDLVDRFNWFTAQELTNMIAVSESTPGPIGINMATYVGYKVAGIPGALISIIGIVTPSIIVILIIARILSKFKDNKYVKAAFYGIRPCVCALIATSGLLIIKSALFNQDFNQHIFELLKPLNIVLFVVLFYGYYKYKKHPIVYIGVAAICGVIFKII